MRELRDEDLILYYYSETRDGDEIRRRLETSPAARERYEVLCRVLETVETQPLPEPHADYGARVWRRLQPSLAKQGRWHDRRLGRLRRKLARWLGAPPALRPVTAGSMIVLLALAFAAGRFWPDGAADPGAALTAAGRERILLVSVGQHLERSEMLLLDLKNARVDGTVDFSAELGRAAGLLGNNRLYRQAARRSGQPAIADLLDELERLLLELAHAPNRLGADELEDLQRRIRDGGLLFRVRVVGSHTKSIQQQQNIPPAAAGEV